MSGIAGIFNRSGEPVDPDLLQRMTQVVNYRGPDGIGAWLHGPLGVSQLLLSTTPESIGEHSPMHDPDSGLVIVFDGRVDNRQELLCALQGHHVHFRTDTDMELVLKSFEHWGAACAEKILGDFAFAIWNQRNRQLFCARDVKGLRPFYYSPADGRFLFGSEIRQLMQHPSVSRKVNADMAAEYLTNVINSLDETLYCDIRRLPPAHYLLVDGNRIQIKRYWDPNPAKQLLYSQHSDYVDHYLELLQKSVECRLRCSGNVGATMSGGLDSTSVVGMAQTIYAERGSQKSIVSFSNTFPGRACDESQEIRQMNQMWGLESVVAPFTKFEADPAWRDQARASFDIPHAPNTTIGQNLLKEAQSRQIKVLLSGTGADGCLGGTYYPYFQAFKSLNWSFIRECLRYQVVEFGWRPAGSRLLRSLAWPILPGVLKKFLMSLEPVTIPRSFAEPDFLAAIRFSDRVRQFQCAWRFRDLAKWINHDALFSASSVYYLEREEAANSEFGIEQRSPFCDRRMLEFALAVPDFQHQWKDQRKRLILAGSKTLIPTKLQKYPNYAHFSNCLQEALKRPMVGKTLRSLKIARAGWVSQEKVTRKYSEVMKKSGQGAEIYFSDYPWMLPLWSVFAIEIWAKEANVELPSLARYRNGW